MSVTEEIVIKCSINLLNHTRFMVFFCRNSDIINTGKKNVPQ